MSATDIVGEFFSSTRALTQNELNWLVKRQGVPPIALAHDPGDDGFVVGAADVTFDRGYFDFVEASKDGAVAALVFIARDAAGDPFDLVAWAPRTDRLATSWGRAALLGEQTLFQPRLSPPAVHRDMLDWLRADRDGVVVVQPERAGRLLRDAPERLVAADEAHARQLAAMLSMTVDLTRIVLPTRKAA